MPHFFENTIIGGYSFEGNAKGLDVTGAAFINRPKFNAAFSNRSKITAG